MIFGRESDHDHGTFHGGNDRDHGGGGGRTLGEDRNDLLLLNAPHDDNRLASRVDDKTILLGVHTCVLRAWFCTGHWARFGTEMILSPVVVDIDEVVPFLFSCGVWSRSFDRHKQALHSLSEDSLGH